MKHTDFKKTFNPFVGLNEEKSSGLAFSVAIGASFLLSILFLIVFRLCGAMKEGYTETDWWRYFSFLLPQLSFAITAGLYFSDKKHSFKETAGKPTLLYIAIAVILQFGLLSLSSLNGLFLKWLERFGYTPSEIAIPSTEGARVLPVIFVIAVLPACLEELFFRGILFNGLKKFGGAAAVLICAAIFSLYHQNPAQTVYQFLCGACFALIVFRSGSIVPTVISHFLNNAVIVIFYACGISEYPGGVVFLCVSAICLVGSLIYLLFVDKRIGGKRKDERKQRCDDGAQENGTNEGNDRQKNTLLNVTAEEEKKADAKGFVLYALFGIAVCALNWISSLISGM